MSAHPPSPSTLHPPLLHPSSHSQALLLDQMALMATSKSGANLQTGASLCLSYGILRKYNQTSWRSFGVHLSPLNQLTLTHTPGCFWKCLAEDHHLSPNPPKKLQITPPFQMCFCRDWGVRRRGFDKEGARCSWVSGAGHQFGGKRGVQHRLVKSQKQGLVGAQLYQSHGPFFLEGD